MKNRMKFCLSLSLLLNSCIALGIENTGSMSDAIKSGNLEKVRMFLEQKTDNIKWLPDDASTPPLHLAAKEGRYEISKELLDRGAPVNELKYISISRGYMSALDEAIFNGNINIVRLLIEKGSSIDKLHRSHWGALSTAHHRLKQMGAESVWRYEQIKEIIRILEQEKEKRRHKNIKSALKRN